MLCDYSPPLGIVDIDDGTPVVPGGFIRFNVDFDYVDPPLPDDDCYSAPQNLYVRWKVKRSYDGKIWDGGYSAKSPSTLTWTGSWNIPDDMDDAIYSFTAQVVQKDYDIFCKVISGSYFIQSEPVSLNFRVQAPTTTTLPLVTTTTLSTDRPSECNKLPDWELVSCVSGGDYILSRDILICEWTGSEWISYVKPKTTKKHAECCSDSDCSISGDSCLSTYKCMYTEDTTSTTLKSTTSSTLTSTTSTLKYTSSTLKYGQNVSATTSTLEGGGGGIIVDNNNDLTYGLLLGGLIGIIILSLLL